MAPQKIIISVVNINLTEYISMRVKHFFFCFLFLILKIGAFSETKIWPDSISSILIQKYTSQIEELSKEKLFEEYAYILDFLEEAITATKGNIDNFYFNKNFIKSTPSLINGKLLIVSQESILRIWDTQTDTFVDQLNIFVGGELVNLMCYMETFNQLNDYWFKMYNQKLRLQYGIDEELGNLPVP
jgi:hypothetical protein